MNQKSIMTCVILFILFVGPTVSNASRSEAFSPEPRHLNEELISIPKKSISLDATTIDQPVYGEATKNANVSKNYEKYNFDTYANGLQLLQLVSPNVVFTEDFFAVIPNMTQFPPASGDHVIIMSYDTSIPANMKHKMTFNNGVDIFKLKVTNRNDSSIRLKFYNMSGTLFYTEEVFPGEVNHQISVSSEQFYSKINIVEITGWSGFENDVAFDDLEFASTNENLIDFEDARLSVPEYFVISFPSGSYVEASLGGFITSEFGMIIPQGKFTSFQLFSYINFFITSPLDREIEIEFYRFNSILSRQVYSVRPDDIQFVEAHDVTSFRFVVPEDPFDQLNLTIMIDNVYFEYGANDQTSYQSSGYNLLDIDKVDNKMDTANMSLGYNYQNVVFETVLFEYTIYDANDPNEPGYSNDLFSNPSTIGVLKTYVSGSGLVTADSMFHSKHNGYYGYSFNVGNPIIREPTEVKRFSIERLEVIPGPPPIYQQIIEIPEFGTYYGPLLSINDLGSLYATDEDRYQGFDSVHVPYNISWHYMKNASLSIMIDFIKSGDSLTSTPILVDKVFINHTIDGNGSLHDEFMYKVIEDGFYEVNITYLLNNEVEKTDNGQGLLTRFSQQSLHYEESISTSSTDNDSSIDTITFRLSLNYSDNRDIPFKYAIVVTYINTNSLVSEIIANHTIDLLINGTDTQDFEYVFTAENSGTYRVAVSMEYDGKTIVTPLTEWFNALPLLLDGTQDSPADLIDNVSLGDDGAPLSILPWLITFIAAAMIYRRKFH